MIIKQVELYKCRIKLKEPFKISLGTLVFAENIIVVLRTDEGITGFGECSPFRTIHGETIETCFSVGQLLGKVFLDKDPCNIADCSALMDAFIYGNTSIKSAFDIAIHDIASQVSGLPLYKFLGGQNKKVITTDYTVSIDTAEKMAADAQKIKEEGFPVIKVKLGGTKDEDLARIIAIRNRIGDTLPMRIDANQGWDTTTAIATLKALEPYHIQHCEEPIRRWNFTDLPLIMKETRIPIMADESCFDHHDAKRLIEMKACHSINVKLGKSSGIHKAIKVVKLAEEADLKIQVGGFLESRLGFTASAHLSLYSDQIVYYDFDTPLMFEENLVSGGIMYGKNGLIELPESPGLGARIEDEDLKKMESVIVRK